ncbi:MAG: hypothetical protein IJW63_04635 [Lachnospiraceae bacterium]|nr:hypothetical protein [Lachnospiraceae bacterium]
MSLWDLKSFVYDCTAKNNEEYKLELKKRMRSMVVLFVLGVLTLITMGVLIWQNPEMMESFRAGLFTGVGVGLMAGSVVGALQLRKRMKDEASLKAARLAETDEREREISNRAIRMTSKVMMVALYLVMLMCTFIANEAVLVVCGLILLFFVSYIVCRKIVSRMM